MAGFFYNLGRRTGPKVRKAKWMWKSMTGDKADAIAVERQVGYDLACEIREQLALDEDQDVQQMVKKTGSRLSKCVANRLLKFDFNVVVQGEPNAFALPGGFIFITRSLIELCERNIDQVAFVLGHEMAHVIKGHAMERIVSSSAIGAASRAVPIRGALGGVLHKVGVKFLESAYSQDLESEADRLGVRLVEAAGYDGAAAIEMLSRLSKVGKGCKEHEIGSYFSSHPPFETRTREINKSLKRR